LTDRIDAWQQYLDDIDKVESLKAVSKEEKKEARLRFHDRRDDMLLGRNAKRALDSIDVDNDEDNNEAGDRTSNSTNISQRHAAKRRRETPSQSSVTVKIEAADKGLSKEDWKEIMAVSSGSGNIDLQNKVGFLQTTVDQLALNAERTNSLLQQLLQVQQRTVGTSHLAHYMVPEDETEEALHADWEHAQNREL
jgi:hypothetical protein